MVAPIYREMGLSWTEGLAWMDDQQEKYMETLKFSQDYQDLKFESKLANNGSITLPTFDHIEGTNNDARLRNHVKNYSRGLNVDHYNTMNNSLVKRIHDTQNKFIQGANEASEPLQYLTGVGGLVKGAVWTVGKIAAKQFAKKGLTKGGLNLFKSGASQTSKSTGWKTGDYFLHLPNKGSVKLNWKANYGALRREMGLNKPIFDSYPAVSISNGLITIFNGTDIYGGEKNGFGRYILAPISIGTGIAPAGSLVDFLATPIFMQGADDISGGK